MHVDASAALGIAQREGLGKLRHLQTNVLWLQSQAVKRALQMRKVDGSRNAADVQTKHVPREVAGKHMVSISCEFREGRSAAAANLHSIRMQIRQLRHELVKLEQKRAITRSLRSSLQRGEQDVDLLIRENQARSRAFLTSKMQARESRLALDISLLST